jgi:hypothetical protein
MDPGGGGGGGEGEVEAVVVVGGRGVPFLACFATRWVGDKSEFTTRSLHLIAWRRSL